MRTQARDHEFRGFYFAQAPRLRRLALLLCGSPSGAEDLTQEALLRAYRAWGRIRNEDPGPYVRRTLVNLHRNDMRRRMLEIRKRPEPVLDSPSHDHDIEQALHVAKALSHLSPVRRATVILRFYEDLPEKEIAALLDRPLGTVKSDLHRALATLRPLLTETAKENR
jgi:RNA polymerase sigma-70 factor (sigma-E family)